MSRWDEQEIEITLTRWELAFIGRLILDHAPQRGQRHPKHQALDDLFGKTTLARLFFADQDRARRRRQKTRSHRTSEIKVLRKMMGEGNGSTGPGRTPPPTTKEDK